MVSLGILVQYRAISRVHMILGTDTAAVGLRRVHKKKLRGPRWSQRQDLSQEQFSALWDHLGPRNGVTPAGTGRCLYR